MITFGLTGGIACGKSTVTKTFVKHNIPMVDADVVARQVVVPGSAGLLQIVELFGSNHLLEDGTLNRNSLAKLVFADPMARRALDRMMLPLITNEVDAQIAKLHQTHSLVGYDAALIIEMGNAKKYRPLIVVSCPTETQLSRLMSRNSLTRDEAMSRINAQVSDKDRRKAASFIIDTSGEMESSVLQTERVITYLRGIDRKNQK